MKCRYCNTEIKQGAKFCPNCGKEVLDNDICFSCGKKIKTGAKFCPHCGANQDETSPRFLFLSPPPLTNWTNLTIPNIFWINLIVHLALISLNMKK